MVYLAHIDAVITLALPGQTKLIKLGRFHATSPSQWPTFLTPCTQDPTPTWEDAILAILADHDINQAPTTEDHWDAEPTSAAQLRPYLVRRIVRRPPAPFHLPHPPGPPQSRLTPTRKNRPPHSPGQPVFSPSLFPKKRVALAW